MEITMYPFCIEKKVFRYVLYVYKLRGLSSTMLLADPVLLLYLHMELQGLRSVGISCLASLSFTLPSLNALVFVPISPPPIFSHIDMAVQAMISGRNDDHHKPDIEIMTL